MPFAIDTIDEVLRAAVVTLQADVDALQLAVTALQADVDALQASVDAVLAVVNTVDSNVITHDLHFHTYERWFGASPGSIGPGLETTMLPWRVTSSATANLMGNAIVLFDGTETPSQTGMLSFDPHRIQIVNVQNNGKTWRIRIADNSGGHTNFAAAVAAGYYSDVVLSIDKTQADSVPIDIKEKRFNSGTKLWVAVATQDAVAQWLDFVIGIHEYPTAA